MPRQEQIIITFVGLGENPDQWKVETNYIPATSEATKDDIQYAYEVAAHVLAMSSLNNRVQRGQAVPPAMLEFVNAHTFKDLRPGM